MKYLKKIEKEYVWLFCLAIGPVIAYSAIYYPALSVLAVIFIIIGIKGTMEHVM